MHRMLNATKENLHVLTIGSSIFAGSFSSGGVASSVGATTPLVTGDTMLQVQAGVVSRAMCVPLTRAIFRATRGNCVVNDLPIDELLLDYSGDTRTGDLVPTPKNFFMVLVSGEVLKNKVAKMCAHFGASMYAYPESRHARHSAEARLRVQLLELGELVAASRQQRRQMLGSVAVVASTWRYTLKRELAILQSLNQLQLDPRRNFFLAQLWVPSDAVGNLRTVLEQAARRSGSDTKPIVSTVETKEAPPTFLRTNKFTEGFQGLVNTYGVPRYREVNPGAFAVIFFPFLFAIMFGDVGHGSMLLLLAVVFIANEEKLSKTKLDDIVGMAFGGRYVLLLNSIFAIYVGFLYNEVGFAC